MRLRLLAAFCLALASGPAVAQQILALEDRPGGAQLDILFLPEDAGRLDAVPEDGATRLLVTGAYSSGERLAPEGMVIRDGRPTHPWPQGWDGLLVVAQSGAASLHAVSAVKWRDSIFDLRERSARERFLSTAARERLSVVQSHLLIRDGVLDLRPVENARLFRRRILFQTRDGRIGVYDTSPRSLTLYDAAAELQQRVDPAMAFNLDMGAYDFCERTVGGEAESCGLLRRDGLDKLTNVIELTLPASPD